MLYLSRSASSHAEMKRRIAHCRGRLRRRRITQKIESRATPPAEAGQTDGASLQEARESENGRRKPNPALILAVEERFSGARKSGAPEEEEARGEDDESGAFNARFGDGEERSNI